MLGQDKLPEHPLSTVDLIGRPSPCCRVVAVEPLDAHPRGCSRLFGSLPIEDRVADFEGARSGLERPRPAQYSARPSAPRRLMGQDASIVP
jgi:hypothetical protein